MALSMTRHGCDVRKHSIAHLIIWMWQWRRPICITRGASRGTGGLSRGRAAIALAPALLLAACAGAPSHPAAYVPDGTILSRLPPGSPGAATYTPEHPLTAEEKARRYNQIDRQALQEQEQSIAAARAAAIAAAAAPRYYDYYGPSYPAYYGGGYGGYGRYGGWGYPRSGWSVGVGSNWGW